VILKGNSSTLNATTLIILLQPSNKLLLDTQSVKIKSVELPTYRYNDKAPSIK
jgi:hypothetical protein